MKGYKLRDEVLKHKEALSNLFWKNPAALKECQDSRIKKLQDILGDFVVSWVTAYNFAYILLTFRVSKS